MDSQQRLGPEIEFWLEGPILKIPKLLQPVAHALLQADAEIADIMQGFDDAKLYLKPGGLASVAFHLQHICGVLDRLFAYGNSSILSESQFEYLRAEGIENANITSEELVRKLHAQIDRCINALHEFPESKLTEDRFVGRKKIKSTLIGLLTHAAEHTMRHTGQLLVTAAWVRTL